ncbi:hypothetical protein CPB85DRAFT_1218084 [Mucidula mucida]|nr:hypothetical protein CPB85DRAFT_1218084 [Mucidula mucida]
MPTPWEALLPFALVTIMFGAGGTLLNVSQRAKNQWKPPRYDIDSWDTVMMRRDKLLTGHARGQVVSQNCIPSYTLRTRSPLF